MHELAPAALVTVLAWLHIETEVLEAAYLSRGDLWIHVFLVSSKNPSIALILLT